jgi:hypothetical protein
MMPSYCSSCQGMGRVCIGFRATRMITDIKPCLRCAGSGWEPKPFKGDAREPLKRPARTGGYPSDGSSSPLKAFNPEEMEL